MTIGAVASASAQVNISTGGADIRWHGTDANARAGAYLDHGTMDGDTRRDLIIGAPGTTTGGLPGRVYIVIGTNNPQSGERPLSEAPVVITGAAANDLFGAAAAAGNILNFEGTNPRNLMVAAPNAESGRGAVYLFAAGLTGGTTVNAAGAVFRLRGAPGDRLGTALASADLDGDGYREIIAGAPGNNRVYVIYGGPSLSGQLDLHGAGSAGVFTALNGDGIGRVMTAGPITRACPAGRSACLYDLFLGSTTTDDVFMISGRAGSRLPAMMDAWQGDAWLRGTGDDDAGASMRIADVDDDGRSDLLIGAPKANGGAGAVYLMFGPREGHPPIQGVMDLAFADVTFTGAPGAGVGAVLTSGDINRDTPDDLALLSQTAANGEVLVYYGRDRAEIGVLLPNGRRHVDLSAAGNVNVRFSGAPAPIESVFVFEVTGEGARDVIVGVPTADTAGGIDSGRVYYAASPSLRLDPATVNLTVVTGAQAERTIALVNRSSTPITVSSEALAPWLRVTTPATPISATAPGTVTLRAIGTGLAAGNYTGTARITSTSEHLVMTVLATVNLTVLTQPTLAANVTFPAASGTPITWTASANGGGATLLYQFWRWNASSGWQMVRDYSTVNSYTWTPAHADAGTHQLQVWVKTADSSATVDAWVSSGSFVIERPRASISSFTNTGAYPVAPNTPIQFTATASPGTGQPEYRFWVWKQGGAFTELRPYSTTNTVTWTPTEAGTYKVQVWVRSVGITDAYEAWQDSPLLQVSSTAPVTVHSLTASATPVKARQPVTFTATATGGVNGPLQYRFWLYNTRTGTWTVVRDFATSPTFTWTPDVDQVGQYMAQVWVRDTVGTETDAWRSSSVFDVVVDPITNVSLSADVAFPVPPNTPIDWTVSAQGGVTPLEYRFYVWQEGSGWALARDYASSPTFTWTPTAAGRYAVQAWVRNAGSSNANDAWVSSPTVTIGASGPASIASFSADRALPATAGTTITWTAVGSGGTTGPLQYRFYRLNQATGVWTLVQDWSSTNTFTWATASGQQGNYVLQVWIRSGTGSATEGWASTAPFTIR